MKQYLVDAFTDRLFSGNPAAVCVPDSWPDDALMKQIAKENNLSETAFLVREGDGYRLRWFTPTMEINLCGHATLASGFVVLTRLEPRRDSVVFRTVSGDLTVTRKGDLYEMDFPAGAPREIPVTDEMEKAYGARPERALLDMDLICVFDSEETVRGLRPDLERMAALPGRLQNATARGTDCDCVSRSFAPSCGIDEDPVCGSAHCLIAPYWAGVLGRERIRARQVSARGGTLLCALTGNGRIRISGGAVLFAVSDLAV